MRLALIVPGGVDRSGEYRIIPALVALLTRLSRTHDVQVFALSQERTPGEWPLAGAHIHNVGSRLTRLRALAAVIAGHRAGRFDLIHAIWSGACGQVAVTAGGLLRVPSLVHIAGGEIVSIPDIEYGSRRTWRGRLREHFTLHAASAVSAASAPVVAAAAALGVSAQRVPLGVDLDVWPPRAPVRRNALQIARLIHVASLNRVKDQPTLLRALVELASAGIEFQCDIVGEDTLAGAVTALARQLNLSSKVTFHGFLPQRRLRPIVEAAHLMIVSSRHETGPLVALEAAVAGVPTIGTAVGHIAEWSPHAALAVPVGDWKGLAEAIARLLAEEELRLSIAREAFRRATLEDADRTAQSFEAIYTTLTAATIRRRRGAR